MKSRANQPNRTDVSDLDCKERAGLTRTQRAVVGVVMVHLVVVLASWTATIGQSETLGRFLTLASPYLKATHFGLDDVPVYLTHGTSADQSRLLAIGSADLSDARPALPAHWAGTGADDRQQRMLLAIETLVDGDQSSLVAELIEPVLGETRDGDVVTLLREPTLLTTTEDDEAPPPYQARVVVMGGQRSLVQLRESRLTASATSTESP